MTSQCKFGIGNHRFIRAAADTCVSVMGGMKLSSLQNHRPQRKRTSNSVVSPIWEGRARLVEAKANIPASANRIYAGTSPASCRQHVRKAIQCNLGDPMDSRISMAYGIQRQIGGRLCHRNGGVGMTISNSETYSDGSWEVGEANSTDDNGDSTTLLEGRSLTLFTPSLGRGGLYSSVETDGGMRI